MIGLIRLWPLWSALGLAVAALAIWTYVGHLRSENGRLRAAVALAKQQAALNQTSANITERVIRSEVIINQRTERAADEVRELPGAEQGLDPAFAAGLSDAILGLRGQATSAHDPAG